MRGLGYTLSTRIGLEYEISVILWTRYRQTEVSAPPYLLEYSDGSRVEYMSAATLPDALDLMSRWAPLATASVVSYLVNEILLNTDRHAGELVEILAAVRANEPWIDSQAHRIRERYSIEDRERREKRRAAEAAEAAARAPAQAGTGPPGQPQQMMQDPGR
jgi:hypothetical protein